MKSTFRTVLALLCCAGFAFGAANDATAATAKKKHVVVKKARHHAHAVRKKAAIEKVSYHQPAPAEGGMPHLLSSSVAVIDQSSGDVLYEKNADAVVPIASITKLMTAMVVLDAHPRLDETLAIGEDDVDTLKGTHSRLVVGTRLTREEMLRLALMSSENRAAYALSRYYPGGRSAFIAAMNAKAQALGLSDTHFIDPTGLTAENVSSARDLVKMVEAAHEYPLIREFTTSEEYQVAVKGRPQTFRNTNALVRSDSWNIGLSKTGYISEAGKCLVMQAWFNNKPTIIVLLDSWGKFTRLGDANRIKRWIESLASRPGSISG